VETKQEWKRIKELFGAALEREPERRAAFLQEACGENVSLRDEIQSLLDAHNSSSNLWKQPFRPQSAENTEGRSIGPYQLIKKIGEGGMGQVWLAQQTAPLNRQVALKLIRWGMYDDSLLHRFQVERQSLAVMDHPAIAKVFDAGATAEGQPYFVMEYAAGVPITEYCDQKKLKIRERLELFIKVCEGVQHAHQKAIIHRDLKPANILVVEVDAKPVPRIIDFGLAKAINRDITDETLNTRMGNFVGTPGYMSPEQCDPTAKDIDTRTDVYSLGVVLYVLLAGSLPFDTKEWKDKPLDEILRRLREEDPLQPSTKVSTDRETSTSIAAARCTEPKQLVSLLRGDLDWITMKAVEKDRTRRYATPSELALDIGRYLRNEPISARPEAITYRVAKFVRRNRVVVAPVTLALAAILAGSGVAIYQARMAQRRFQDVRKLAHTFVFDLHDEVAKLQGSTKAREMMVQTGLQYLDNLAQNAGGDLELQREIAAGYMKIGAVQGYPTQPNLGRVADATASFGKAGEIYQRIARKNDAYLPDLAAFYRSYAGLFRSNQPQRARELYEAAIQTFDQSRAHEHLDPEHENLYARAWCNVGDIDEDLHKYGLAWTEFEHCSQLAHAQLDRKRNQESLIMVAESAERVGTAAQELGHLREAIEAFDEDENAARQLLAAEPLNPRFHRLLAIMYQFRGRVYFSDAYPNYGDPERALRDLRLYLETVKEMLQQDPNDTSAQNSVAIAEGKVSYCLQGSDPPGAIRLARDSIRIFDQMIASNKGGYLRAVSSRAGALRGLGEAQLKAGRLVDARRSADLALAASREVNQAPKDRAELVEALILAGNVSAATKDLARAESLLNEARDVAQGLARPEELTNLIPLATAEEALGAFYVRRHRNRDARACYQHLVDLWQHFPESNEYVDHQRTLSSTLLSSLR